MGTQKAQKMGEKENCRILFFNKKKKTIESKNTEHLDEKIHKRKQQFQKIKNVKWSFHGAANSKLRYSKSSKKYTFI